MRPAILLLVCLAGAWACRPLDGFLDGACPLPLGAPVSASGTPPLGAARLLIYSQAAPALILQDLKQQMAATEVTVSVLAAVNETNLLSADVIRVGVLDRLQHLHTNAIIGDYLIVVPGVGLTRYYPSMVVASLTWGEIGGGTDAVLLLDLEWDLAGRADLVGLLGVDLARLLRKDTGWTVLSAANSTGRTQAVVEFAVYEDYLLLSTITDRTSYPALRWTLSVQQQCPSGLIRPLCEGADALGALTSLTKNFQIVLGTLIGVIALLIAAVTKLWSRIKAFVQTGASYLTRGTVTSV